jgi:hypothetical protein
MATQERTNLTAAEITEARAWLMDCQWADMESEHVATLSDAMILWAVARHYEGGIEQFKADADYYGVWKSDPESLMPPSVQRTSHKWSVAAGKCYRLRNESHDYLSEGPRAENFEAIGDVYMRRAVALINEWSE